MLYVLRTGIPWRDLPKIYGYWHIVYLRFKKGSDRGVWWHILMKLQQDKKLQMNIVLTDSTTIKIHRHGGGLKGEFQSRGRSISVMTTKLHLVITSEGHVIEGMLTGGNVADISVADSITEDISGCYVMKTNDMIQTSTEQISNQTIISQ